MMFTTTLAMVANWCESLTMCQAAPDRHCSMLDQCCPLEKILLIPHVWNLKFSGLGTSKDFELKVSRVKIIISLFLTPDYKLLTWPFTNQPFVSTPLATATDPGVEPSGVVPSGLLCHLVPETQLGDLKCVIVMDAWWSIEHWSPPRLTEPNCAEKEWLSTRKSLGLKDAGLRNLQNGHQGLYRNPKALSSEWGQRP